MANEFLQQVNRFGQFLVQDTARLEQENRRKRVNQTVVEAAEALNEAEGVNQTAEVYQNVAKYAASTDSMEAMAMFTPMYQQKLGTLEYERKEKQQQELRDLVTRSTGMELDDTTDPMQAISLMSQLNPKLATQVMQDPTGQQRIVMFTKSPFGKDGTGKPSMEIEWKDNVGLSPAEQARAAAGTAMAKNNYEYNRQAKLAILKGQIKMTLEQQKSGPGGVNAVTYAQHRLRNQMLATGVDAEATVLLNRVSDYEAFKELYSVKKNKNLLSEGILKDNQRFAMDDLMKDPKFQEELEDLNPNDPEEATILNSIKKYQDYRDTLDQSDAFLDNYGAQASGVPLQQAPKSDAEVQPNNYITPQQTTGKFNKYKLAIPKIN